MRSHLTASPLRGGHGRRPAPGHGLVGLLHPHRLLRRRPRHRVLGSAQHQDQPRLLPVRPVAACVGDRPRVHRGQPRRPRDPGHGGERRAVRHRDDALLLDRRRPGHGVPRHRDDAVLLRLQGAQRPRVHAAALQQRDAQVQRGQLRRGHGADRRRQPLRARDRDPGPAGLAGLARDPRRGRLRARLHHGRRADLGGLQRGAAVLRDPGRPDPAGRDRPARARRLVGSGRRRHRKPARRRGLPARLAGHRSRQRDEPHRRQLDRDRDRSRFRAVLRLLDDELRRGAARPVGQEHVRRPSHPAHRGLPEDLHPGDDHHPRADRARGVSQAGRRRQATSSTTTRSRC